MRMYRAIPIKKDKNSGEFIKGHHFRVGCRHFLISLHCVVIDIYPSPFIRDFIEVHPSTVGQSTGLHDKNGTEIFEGDVVRELVACRPDRYKDKIVVWSNGSFKIDTADGRQSFLEWPASVCLEIIGSIHTPKSEKENKK